MGVNFNLRPEYWEEAFQEEGTSVETSRGEQVSEGLWIRASEKDKEKSIITSFIRHFTSINMA